MWKLVALLLLFVAEVLGAGTFQNPIKKTDGSDPYMVRGFPGGRPFSRRGAELCFGCASLGL